MSRLITVDDVLAEMADADGVPLAAVGTEDATEIIGALLGFSVSKRSFLAAADALDLGFMVGTRTLAFDEYDLLDACAEFDPGAVDFDDAEETEEGDEEAGEGASENTEHRDERVNDGKPASVDYRDLIRRARETAPVLHIDDRRRGGDQR